MGEIREDLETNWRVWREVLAAVPVHGADTEPGAGRAEPQSVVM